MYMLIREFDENTDMQDLRDCLIELQDFERSYDPRMPSGRDIVDTYIPEMLRRCKRCDGKVLVAEIDGEVAGYATVLARVRSDEPEDGDFEYGLVSDLVILQKFRKLGLARRLLAEAESYARACGVKWLRVGVMAENQVAKSLYSSIGFSNIYVELEKDLGGSD